MFLPTEFLLFMALGSRRQLWKTTQFSSVNHRDAFFAEVSILAPQKVIHSSDEVIITVEMASNELPLYLEEEVVVFM